MNYFTITCPKNEKIFIHALPGHYISASSHLNYYIGTSDIKHNYDVSIETASLMAEYYIQRDIDVDTVLCLYETQALGAYLAQELSKPSILNRNKNGSRYSLGPEYDAAGNIIFRDNLKKMIKGKSIILLISCITSGKVIKRAIESTQYYGGHIAGITSIFSAVDEIDGIEVNTIFTPADIPNYQSFAVHNCQLCKDKMPVNALINGYGYSTI